MKKIFCFDIDGVICARPNDIEHLGKKKYEQCYQLQSTIDIINQLYDSGHTIKLFTSRGMSMYKGDLYIVHDELYEFTYNQMKEFGVKFHELILGKPAYDFIIDDKAINSKDMNSIKEFINS